MREHLSWELWHREEKRRRLDMGGRHLLEERWEEQAPPARVQKEPRGEKKPEEVEARQEEEQEQGRGVRQEEEQEQGRGVRQEEEQEQGRGVRQEEEQEQERGVREGRGMAKASVSGKGEKTVKKMRSRSRLQNLGGKIPGGELSDALSQSPFQHHSLHRSQRGRQVPWPFFPAHSILRGGPGHVPSSSR